RQSLASSTQARVNWSGYCSSLVSRRSSRVKASAVAPAKPAITLPLPRRRTFLALPFIMVCPRLTWPSPAITTLPPLRTVTIVVACMVNSLDINGSDFALSLKGDWRGTRNIGNICMRRSDDCKGSAKGVDRRRGCNWQSHRHAVRRLAIYVKEPQGNSSMSARAAEVSRKTKETEIAVSIDVDGTGRSDISTGVGFFDHMLDQLSRHSLIDMTVRTKGDLHIDDHHTVEDTGIVLGQALAKALGERRGIVRYASIDLAM